MATKKKAPDRYVVVATASRPWSVVCGRLEEQTATEIILTEARMALYWPSSTRGIIGLAQIGPPPGSRVSQAADRIVLRRVEMIIDATPEALERWRAEPWS